MDLKHYIKNLSIIHICLVAGLAIFIAFVLFQNKGFNSFTNENNVLLYIVPVAAILGYLGSQFLFKKMTDTIKRTEPLINKLAKYQTALITKMALIEGPAFLGLYVYSISGNALPLVIALCLLAYLIVQRPNKNSIFKSIPLTQEEIQLIQQI